MVKKITKPTIYTEEFVKGELTGFIKSLKENEEILFIKKLIEDKSYSSQRFSEWRKKFEKNEKISELIKKIEDILETRNYMGAVTNKLNPTMVIFYLKNHHGWKNTEGLDLGNKDGKPFAAQVIVLPNRTLNEKTNLMESQRGTTDNSATSIAK